MKETKSEIYKIFKKSLDDANHNYCNNECLLGTELDAAVKKSAVYLLYTLKKGNMSELIKEYVLLKANFRNVNTVYIVFETITNMILSIITACLSSFASITYIIVPVLLDIIKELYVKELTESNLFANFNLDWIYNIIFALLIIGLIFTIAKEILEVRDKEPAITMENYNKKIFDTIYRDKYIKILSQMISNPNKFENMSYFEFTMWTRYIIFYNQ